MALPDLFPVSDFYFKKCAAVPPFARDNYTAAFCLFVIINRHLVITFRAFHTAHFILFYFLNPGHPLKEGRSHRRHSSALP